MGIEGIIMCYLLGPATILYSLSYFFNNKGKMSMPLGWTSFRSREAYTPYDLTPFPSLRHTYEGRITVGRIRTAVAERQR